MSEVQPPAYSIHEIHLREGPDGKDPGRITEVNVYPSRAEVCRSYRLKVASGQNKAVVYGLTNVLNHDSLRVEGRGKATIQDVTISREVPDRAPSTSPTLESLKVDKEDLTAAIQRCEKTISGLDHYFRTLDVHHAAKANSDASHPTVLPLLDDYHTASEKYDTKLLSLKRHLKKLEIAIIEEEKALQDSVKTDSNRLMKVTVGLFADAEAEIELKLKYAVSGAGWVAVYDVRVSTDDADKEHPVEIVYKAAIHQHTGEDWTDVPITLETASPTFNLSLPQLDVWNLSIYKPRIVEVEKSRKSRMQVFSAKKESVARRESSESIEESDNDMGFGLFDGDDAPAMQSTSAPVASKGGVNAAFRVPGLVSIPPDGVARNVTIASLSNGDLEARIVWLAVPSADAMVHLTSNIKNKSDFTFLAGASNIYVDGSFISKSTVPLVGPQETFTCRLGTDPSIRITNYPLRTNRVNSGTLSLSKTTTTTYTQRISVYNSKASQAVHDLKILARVPVSEDAGIVVKVLEPKGLTSGVSKQAKVVDGVVVGWVKADNDASKKPSGNNLVPLSKTSTITSHTSKGTGSTTAAAEEDTKHLGKDGKVQWACSLEAQRKVDLTLSWEVTHAREAVVVGL